MIWQDLPIDHEGVQDIINKTSATFLKNDEGKKFSDIAFFSKRLNDLKQLHDQVLDSEIAFYTAIGKKDFKELMQAVEDVNDAKSKFSQDKILIELASDPQIISVLNTVSFDAIVTALEKIDFSLNDLFSDQELIGEIIQEFNKENKNSVDSKRKTSGYFMNLPGVKDKDPKGFQRVFKVKRSSTDKVFNLQLASDDIKVSSKFKKKLLELIQERTNQIAPPTLDLFKQRVFDVLKKMVSGFKNSNMFIQCLDFEINNHSLNYDVNWSWSSLKGFVGEIWSNALISTLLGQPGKSLPTGNIRMVGSGYEIGVDAILENFNFQIKSFILDDNGRYTMRGKSQIGEFINQRAQMDEAGLLTTFFGSYQFNQPFSEKVKIAKDNPMTTADYASTIYNQFDPIIKQLGPAFQAYVDKIIRLDSTFQGDHPAFGKEQLYFNTFFIVNDKFVPASAMLSAIIDEFESANDRAIEFKINGAETNPGKTTFEQVILLTEKANNPNIKVNPLLKQYTQDVEKVANAVSLKYTITYNFTSILKRAYEKAAKYSK